MDEIDFKANQLPCKIGFLIFLKMFLRQEYDINYMCTRDLKQSMCCKAESLKPIYNTCVSP